MSDRPQEIRQRIAALSARAKEAEESNRQQMQQAVNELAELTATAFAVVRVITEDSASVVIQGVSPEVGALVRGLAFKMGTPQQQQAEVIRRFDDNEVTLHLRPGETVNFTVKDRYGCHPYLVTYRVSLHSSRAEAVRVAEKLSLRGRMKPSN